MATQVEDGGRALTRRVRAVQMIWMAAISSLRDKCR
jgi:hypothetical protein